VCPDGARPARARAWPRIVGSAIALEGAILLALWDRRVSFFVYIAIQLAYVIRTTRTPTGAPPQQ